MRSQRGMSLIEATVILGVISMLTAMMAPAVRSYVQTAQQTAAQKDVQTIAAAISRFLTDVGELWLLQDGAKASGTTSAAAPSHLAANRVDLLVSDGAIPAVNTARSTAGTDWGAAVGIAAIQKLEYYLVLNTPSNNSAKAYRTYTGVDGVSNYDPDSGGLYNAPFAWRGAYMPGPIGADPWGNRYAVNVEFLARAVNATAATAGAVNDVIVLSAGNNGLIETRFNTDGVTSANDVIHILSGATP